MVVYKNLYDAVSAANGTLLFRKKAIQKASAQLHGNENIYYAGMAIFANNLAGVIVVTQFRVFGYASMIGDSYYQEIPINNIRNVSYSTLEKALHIYGDVCTIDAIVFNRSTLKNINKVINGLKNINSNLQIKKDNIEPTINTELLKELKELEKAGVITSQEFEAKKKQILDL